MPAEQQAAGAQACARWSPRLAPCCRSNRLEMIPGGDVVCVSLLGGGTFGERHPVARWLDPCLRGWLQATPAHGACACPRAPSAARPVQPPAVGRRLPPAGTTYRARWNESDVACKCLNPLLASATCRLPSQPNDQGAGPGASRLQGRAASGARPRHAASPAPPPAAARNPRTACTDWSAVCEPAGLVRAGMPGVGRAGVCGGGATAALASLQPPLPSSSLDLVADASIYLPSDFHSRRIDFLREANEIGRLRHPCLAEV